MTNAINVGLSDQTLHPVIFYKEVTLFVPLVTTYALSKAWNNSYSWTEMSLTIVLLPATLRRLSSWYGLPNEALHKHRASSNKNEGMVYPSSAKLPDQSFTKVV